MKRNKKLLTAVATILSVFSAFALVACNNEDPEPQPEQVTPSLTLVESSYAMLTYETLRLVPPVVTGFAEYTLTYTSDDPSVASVSSDGIVTSYDGTGNVTVTVGVENTELAATCNITVIDTYELPTLELNNVKDLALNLYSGQKFVLDASVMFRGQKVSGGNIALSSSAEGVISTENNVITALSAGDATLTVSANYLNTPLEKTVSVKVSDLKNEVDISFTSEASAGATVPAKMESIARGSVIALPAAITPSNNAYEFGGWTDGIDVYPASGEFLVSSVDLTFDAVWYKKVGGVQIRAYADAVSSNDKPYAEDAASVKATVKLASMNFKYDGTGIDKTHAHFSVKTDADLSRMPMTLNVGARSYVLRGGWNKIDVAKSELDAVMNITCAATQSLKNTSFYFSELVAADAFVNKVEQEVINQKHGTSETSTERVFGEETSSLKVVASGWSLPFMFTAPETAVNSPVTFRVYSDNYEPPADNVSWWDGRVWFYYGPLNEKGDVVSDSLSSRRFAFNINEWTEITLSADEFNAIAKGKSACYFDAAGLYNATFYFSALTSDGAALDSSVVVEQYKPTSSVAVTHAVSLRGELASTAVKSYEWNLKLGFKDEITDANADAVKFYVYTDWVNLNDDPNWIRPISFICGSELNVSLTDKDWTEVVMPLELYNSVVRGDAQIEITDQNGLQSSTFYFSQVTPVRLAVNGISSTNGALENDTATKYGSDEYSTKLTAKSSESMFNFKDTATADGDKTGVQFMIYASQAGGVFEYGDTYVTLKENTWNKIRMPVADFNAAVGGDGSFVIRGEQNAIYYISASKTNETIYESEVSINLYEPNSTGISAAAYDFTYNGETYSSMIKSTIWNTKFEFEKTIPANTTTVEMYVYCPEWAGVYLADTKISEVWEKEWTKLTLTAEQYNAVLNGQSEIKLEGSSSLSNKAIYFSNIKTYREKSGDVYFDHALGTIDEDTTIKYGSEQSSVKLTVTAERRHLMYKYCTAVDETQYNAVLLRVYQTDAQSVSWDTAYFMLGAKDTVIDSPDVKLALNKGSWTEILITPAQYNAVVRGEKVIALGSGYSFYNDVPFYLSAPTPVNDGIADHMLINMPIGIDDEISLTSYSSSIKHGDDSLSTCVPQANWEKISVRFENAIDDTDVNAVKLYVYADVKYGSTFNAAAVTLGTTSVGNVSAQETWTEIILTKAQFNSLTDDSGTVLTFANSSSGINGMIFYFSSITPYNDPLLSSPIQVKAGAGMSVSDYTGSDITPPESGLGFKKCDCSDWNAYFTFDCDAQIDTSITSNVSFYIWSNYVPGVDWCPNGYIQFGDKRLALLSTEGTWVKVTLSMSDFKALLSGEKSMYLEGNGYSGVTVYVSDIIIG